MEKYASKMQQSRLIFFCSLLLNCQFIIGQRACPPKDLILPCRCLLRSEEFQIWCSHSNLPSVLGSLKSIAKHLAHPVDELILENNFLPSLPGRTFYPLRVLRLMLRHNNLERVSSDFLSGLEPSLMEIFIVEPRLSSLPDLSLAQLRNLKAVTLQAKLLKRLPLFSGLPKLRYIQTESEHLSELSPRNFKSLPSLEKLHVSFSPKLTRLEANLLGDLPKLELVNVTGCGIEWVHVGAFSGLPALRELVLTGNKLADAAVVGRGSRGLPRLEVIRLDYNNLSTVGEASFKDLPSLRSLSLANNQIREIQQGAFQRLPKLKKLDVSHNSLRSFSTRSFSHSSESTVEEILLAHNDISDVAELRNILDSSPTLSFLDLSHNQLRNIPFGALRGHPTLEQIDLGFNKLTSIDKEAFIAMPALRELRLANNSVSDLLPPPFWNLPALKGLDLSRNGLGRLEPMFLSNVGALRRVDLSRNSLGFVDPEAFLPTPFLEHVNMSSNVLRGLHVVTLRHLGQLYEVDVSDNFLRAVPGGLPRNLEYLRLRNNEIGEVSSRVLDLPSLRLLDLSRNRIEAIPKGALKELVKLKRLYLGSNLLRHLEEFSLDGLNNLETLDLSNNRLVQIYQSSLKSLTSLKYFNVENNQLSVLGSELLISSKNVLQINLSGNQLPEILTRALDTNKQTELLDLSRNLLIQIPQTIHGNTNLRKLDLTDNRIKNINTTIINSLAQLRELRLSKNFIQAIEEGSFVDQKHLKVIHLDDNEIEYMEPKSLGNLPALKLLKLGKNKLKTLPNAALHNLPQLQVLELQHNKLTSIKAKAFSQVPQLLMLNLSHNELGFLEDVGLQGLSSLELLDLSHNKITKLSGRSLDKLEWLVELRIDSNTICEVEEGVFDKLLRLKLLSIKHNRITYIPEMATQRLRSNIATIDVQDNPLVCSCNMLWLQAWIRETSEASPTCSDGSSLREVPLSSQDCPQEERQRKGGNSCDAEIFTTSQVLASSKYSLRNGSKTGFGGENNLAPTPEESEYFYDYYIDYPFNETLMDPKMVVTTQSALEKFLQTTSNDNVTGDTPTLYAAPSKKPKPDIPQKVSHSPSNSGFTFFGLPLPEVNLKTLFKPERSLVPAAEAKAAIVNEPPKSKRQFGAQLEAIQPPKMPELQGGFVPVLPGYGGFKPMVDSPRMSPGKQQQVQPQQVEPQQVQPQQVKPQQMKPQQVQPQQVKQQQMKPQQVEPQQMKPQQVQPQQVKQQKVKSQLQEEQQMKTQRQQMPVEQGKLQQVLGQSQLHQLQLEQPEPEQKQPELQKKSMDVEQVKKFTLERSNHSIYLNLTGASSTSNRSQKSQLAAVKLEAIANVRISNENISLASPEPTGTSQIIPTTILLDQTKDESSVPTTVKPPQLKETLKGSVLTTLLAPSGQQPQFKPTAKSTITKVQNPRPPDGGSEEKASLESALTFSEFPDYAKVESARVESVVSDDSIITSTEDDGGSETNGWYFENYDRTNVEPFVAKIRASRGSRKGFVCSYVIVVLVRLIY